jgi:predicted metalloprotease
MKWTRGHRSGNIVDRRGSRGGFGGFGGMSFPGFGGGRGGGKMGLTSIVILLVVGLCFGGDFLSILGGGDPTTTSEEGGTVAVSPEEDTLTQFVGFVLDDAQGTWGRIFESRGRTYQPARLVLFRDATQSACGVGQAAMGPFYCPGDQMVYIDLGFFEELKRRFGAPGDFAQAYVLAHEIGHHVQALLGTERQVREQQQTSQSQRNELSVKMELQADCYAGIWAHSTSQRQLLEQGDLEEGLGAAAAVGDDRIQQQQTGSVSPESFTHGTARERAEWFRRGFTSGSPQDCDTFQRF